MERKKFKFLQHTQMETTMENNTNIRNEHRRGKNI